MAYPHAGPARMPEPHIPPPRAWLLLMAAWLVAVIATAGALFLGEVMGMTPCLLCWYQRIAMFPLPVVLGIATWSNDRRGAIYALPLAAIGAAIALFHTALAAGFVPAWWMPCEAGAPCTNQRLDFLGGIQLPWLALAAFLLILGLLWASLSSSSRKTP